MKKLVLVLLASLPMSQAMAATLTVDDGINVLFVNGVELIDDQEQYSLNDGQNQIVANFTGRLREGGKTEYLSTNPYVITFDASSTVNVLLTHNSYSQIDQANNNSQPIFQLTGASNITQDVLPKGRGFIPYNDKDELLAKYNATKGFNYGVAPIATTATVATPVVYQQQTEQELKTLDDTDTLNQLKHWYMQATEEEKVEFKQWLIFN